MARKKNTKARERKMMNANDRLRRAVRIDRNGKRIASQREVTEAVLASEAASIAWLGGLVR